MTALTTERHYPIGAEILPGGEVHFRVWAPKARQVAVVIEGTGSSSVSHPLTREESGYFSGATPGSAGSRYRFKIDDCDTLYPDPASRYQPDGPHGPSCVVDPRAFKWTDEHWRGIQMAGQIIYEFHVGTFTSDGTWRAAAEKLPQLREQGITLLEMMPIADFPGDFGWGYDGVNLFAPCRLYGAPDDLRYFIDRAHALGFGVILDVVYNHFGPDGNYIGAFSDDYMTAAKPNEWGDSINFDGRNSAAVRELFITNGRYWIEEFHFDGFRFDATQSIHDKSDEYIVGAIGRAARNAAAGRSIVLIAENETQETKLIRPKAEGGDDLDGLWNDDWHHTAIVAATGRSEAYYTDYEGSPQEFISAAKYGYLFQGQPYSWQVAPRGVPTYGSCPEAFVAFLENHDQVSNSAYGKRLRVQTSPGLYRALTSLLLLGPWTPLLFQGQEFGATTPFLYFSEVGDEKLQEAVREGRFKFLAQFPSVNDPNVQKLLAVPSARSTFDRSKLDWSNAGQSEQLSSLFRDLIRLRADDSRFRELVPGGVDGAVLGRQCFLLRYFGKAAGEERLLMVNFGNWRRLSPVPEPLLAPPLNCEWETLWTSENPKYGGLGFVPFDADVEWQLPAESVVALRAVPRKKPRPQPIAR